MATAAQAKKTAGEFDFQGEIAAAEPYGEGHINDTFRVTVNAGGESRHYILQRVNTQIFRQPALLMDNVTAVTKHLAQNSGGAAPGAEFLQIVYARDGKTYYTSPSGEVWRAMTFIEGGVSFQTGENPRLFAAAAKGFGQFARMLDSFPAAGLHETIPRFHDTQKRLRDFIQAAEEDAHGRAEGCRAETDFILARQGDCGVLAGLQGGGELPLRVTHNDTKLNNVLINPKTLQPVCVIDLDTVMPGLVAHDFGDAIRSGASTAAEDERDLSLVNFSLPLYLAYAESYLRELGGVLTQREKETLHWGAKLMTLECGMRFLTDHLQGDAYFRIRRENHNLDRARTQLKMVAEMEKQWGNMAIGR